MTALAIALGYLGTLAFGAFYVWHRNRYHQNVLDPLNSLIHEVNDMQAARQKWDDAASYVEAERLKRGVLGVKRA